MHSNLIGLGAIEVEGVNRFQDIRSELFPGVTLREDGLGEAFRAVPAVGFLGDLKYQLVHNTTLPYQVPGESNPQEGSRADGVMVGRDGLRLLSCWMDGPFGEDYH